jgi:hypothetical protein
MTDYEALKLFGHSPAKAKEIILDAKRGDKFSQQYLDLVKRHPNFSKPKKKTRVFIAQKYLPEARALIAKHMEPNQ